MRLAVGEGPGNETSCGGVLRTRLRCGHLKPLCDSICACYDCLSTGLHFQELRQRVCHQTNKTEGTNICLCAAGVVLWETTFTLEFTGILTARLSMDCRFRRDTSGKI